MLKTSASTAGIAPTQSKTGYKVIAYYYPRENGSREYNPETIQPGKLTHLNYAFAGITDGEVALSNELSSQEHEKYLAHIVQIKRRDPTLQTLISLGGWHESKDFSNIALTADARLKFANSAVAFMRTYQFDGVDVDWEFPVVGGSRDNIRRPEDKKNFTLLLQVLREKLNIAGKEDHRTYLLSAAIGSTQQFFNSTEMAEAIHSLDWVNIMTYNYNGHWGLYAGHHSALYHDPMLKHEEFDENLNIHTSIDLALQAGIPAHKVVLGIPFYGYCWKQCKPANNGQLQNCSGKGRGTWEDGVLDFSDIDANLVNKNGFVRYWNDVAKAGYLFNANTGEFITYDDPESLDYKIKYLKERCLGGAMFWEITNDRNFVLQDKLARDLLGR